MTWSEYLGSGISFFFRPFRTLSELSGEFRELPGKTVLSRGLLSLALGSVSATLANLITGGNAVSGNAGMLVLVLFSGFAASLALNVLLIAVYYFCRNFLVAQPGSLELFAGLYLAPELLSLVLLPVAIVSSALGSGGGALYGLTALLVFVLTVALKVRALSLAAGWSGGRAIAVFLLPYAFLVLFGVVSAFTVAGMIVRSFAR